MSVEGPLKPLDHSKVEFLRYHKPPLRAGNYEVRVTQNIASSGKSGSEITGDFSGYSVSLVDADPAQGVNLICLKLSAGANAIWVFDGHGDLVIKLVQADLGAAKKMLKKLATDFKDIPTGTPNLEASHPELMAKLAPVLGTLFTARKTFSVAGERFALKPQEIVSVFPPDGSKGDHGNVLPHVILRRSTLPWERRPIAHLDGPPPEHPFSWMGILLFNDAPDTPAPKPHIIPLGTLGEGPENSLYNDRSVSFLREDLLMPEGGEKADMPVRVIDVPVDQVLQLVPSERELTLMAHVRQRVTAMNEEVGTETPVVIGNRLPQRAGASVAFLVSLEHRYAVPLDRPDTEPVFWIAEGASQVRFVVLKSWNFSVPPHASYLLTKSQWSHLLPKMSTAGAKKMAGVKDAVLGHEVIGEQTFTDTLPSFEVQKDLPLDQQDLQLVLKTALYRKLSFKSLLMELDKDTLRLDPVSGPGAEYVARGHKLMPHYLRNGNMTASWYHGPLSDGAHERVPVEPHARTADHLLRYDADLGLLDSSYAAAWQLGRLMTLQAKSVSLALYNWKRAHAIRVKGADQQLTHLPFNRLPGPLDMPRMVREWFYETALLNGVPFTHLVPDHKMLPDESIRFFQLDATWIESLLDGAFSIGRLNANDVLREQDLLDAYGAPLDAARGTDDKPFPVDGASGVLIKSDVIEGWPHLQVDGLVYIGANDAAAFGRTLDNIRAELSQEKVLSMNTWKVFDQIGLALPDPDQCQVQISETVKPKKAVAWIVRGPGGVIEFEVINDTELHGPGDEDHVYGDRLVLKLPLLRFDHLAPGVLLAIFHGKVEAVDVHLKPEAIHFGVSEPHHGHPFHYKELRDAEGHEDPALIVDPVLFRRSKDPNLQRIVDLETLVFEPGGIGDQIGVGADITSAEFALQMVEGVERVRFDMARDPD